jgi:hypothetical protein
MPGNDTAVRNSGRKFSFLPLEQFGRSARQSANEGGDGQACLLMKIKALDATAASPESLR